VIETVPLDPSRHERKKFDCSVARLNRFLQQTAHQQSRRDNSRTYVLEDPEDSAKITGFYTVTIVNLSSSNFPEYLRKRHPHTTAAALIARLAVDRRHQRRGVGSWMLVDALRRILASAETLGFPMVVVDAKDGAEGFYEAFGFKAMRDQPQKLYLTVADIRAAEQAADE